MVSLCKPVIYKLKILGGGKREYYKSMGEPQQGRSIFWDSIGGGSKRGRQDFWLKSSVCVCVCVGGGDLGAIIKAQHAMKGWLRLPCLYHNEIISDSLANLREFIELRTHYFLFWLFLFLFECLYEWI